MSDADKFAWMKALGRTKGLSAAQYACAIAVWNNSNGDGVGAFVSAASVARDTGLAVSTTERAMRTLRDRGVIVQTSRGGGRRRASMYSLGVLAAAETPALTPGVDDETPALTPGSESDSPALTPGDDSGTPALTPGSFLESPALTPGKQCSPGVSAGPSDSSSCVGIREDRDSDPNDGRFSNGIPYPPDPAEPTPPGGPVVTDALRTMVRQIVGRLSRHAIDGLARHVAAALAQDVPEAAIRTALAQWRDRDKAKPGLLPYLIDDAAKELSATTARAAAIAGDPAAARAALAEQAREIVETARHDGDITRLEPLWLASDDPEALAGHGFEFNPDWGTTEDQQRREWILDRFDRLARLVHADLQRRAAA
ncbi:MULTISPECIES: hypothetical protein [Tsukamurella]|uniref:Helix-turn-helix domain-containing protein n=2 Tax=Tsukamurella TaxID=2060 RepID=A0A5C5S6K1_9ACTN|nr:MULTISPECIES: hypothetical protein [Tsukamurella]NMD55201.1 hypothetical protein [Tsukamurella columbiensis]TWS30223.1 hypothetical protein FK530_06865 [Tsukamurella conjunctivitidis]